MRAGMTNTPETIAKMSHAKRAMMAQEAYRTPAVARLRRLAADPAERERRRQQMLAQWRDPVFVEAWAARQRSPVRQVSAEVREARRLAMPAVAHARAAALARAADRKVIEVGLAGERVELLRAACDVLATNNDRNKVIQRLMARLTLDEGWRLQLLRAIGIERADALVWIVALHPSVEVAS